MIALILLVVLLVLNIWFGVKHVKFGNTTKAAALSWFVIGWLSFHVLIYTLPTLL
jgi:hypothetical protein